MLSHLCDSFPIQQSPKTLSNETKATYGVQSTMEENLSQENRFLVKESKLDKIMMVKFFIALLLTNSITYLIAFPPAESNKIIPEDLNI